jgi:Flp pilus assembly protein TadG
MHINFRNLWAHIWVDQSGVTIIEFAYCLPIFMGLCLTGIELGNMASVNMKISQLTMTVADNLSRAKQSVPLGLPQFREHDVNDAFVGAKEQGGALDVLKNGRIIVSSLQRNASNGQWIAWQRCKGLKNVVSAYGVEGTGKTGTAFLGMGTGAAADKVTAPAGAAIIFVEVEYTYQPLVSGSLLGPKTMKKEAAFYVRDDRDISGGTDSNGVYNPSPTVTASKCNLFSAT